MEPVINFSQPLDEAHQMKVKGSQKFKNYLARLGAEFDISQVTVDRVYWFGKKPDQKPGIIMVAAEGTTRSGETFPGTLTMIRGDSVAVLIILETPDGGEYTVLARQSRIAAGEANFEEIPAGMVDEGKFKCKALDELSEEIGDDLGITEDDLVELDSYQPSPGACDESLCIYYARKPAPPGLIERLSGRVAGSAAEGERINVEVIPFDDLADRALTDGKTRMAYYGYCAAVGRVARRPGRRLEAAPAAPRV